MRKFTDQQTFDEGLFIHLFLSKPHQEVQAVPVSFQDNAINELAASVDRILEIIMTFNGEVYFFKGNLQTTKNDATCLCHTLTRRSNAHHNCRHFRTPQRNSSRRSVSRKKEIDTALWRWYHNKYGRSSRIYRKPFSFSSSGPSEKKNILGNFLAGTS